MYSCLVYPKDVDMQDGQPDPEPRKTWLSLLAKAPDGEIPKRLDACGARPGFTWLRQPEIGSVMVRGRAGGTGAPFNLGEMTITRCAVRLDSGEVGHGYVQGRRKRDAEAAALADAMLQTDAADRVHQVVIDPIAAMLSADKETRARKAAATKVDFFTMVRGED